MAYQPGDTITQAGVVYTYNGTSWTFRVDVVPGGVSSTKTYAGTPVPDPETRPVDQTVEYDFAILSGLATGALYANEVQVG